MEEGLFPEKPPLSQHPGKSQPLQMTKILKGPCKMRHRGCGVDPTHPRWAPLRTERRRKGHPAPEAGQPMGR